MEFIAAKDLPATEAESVEVLCLENGELKKKALAAAAVADITDAPTAENFNALLASLRNAGLMEG